VLVEIDPPHGGRDELDQISKGLKLLYSRGIRYITIGDNPGREPRLDRYLFSRMVLDSVPDFELVLHLACADRTLVSFSTELESLKHVTPNVLVISGDPPSGDFATSSAPYDMRSVRAIRSFTRRNYGVSLMGEEGLPPTAYFVGGAFNPRAIKAQARKFSTKALHAGASFAMTQPIFDADTVTATAEVFADLKEQVRREQGRELSVYPGVMPFTTLRNATLLRDRFGMPVPKTMLEELETLSAEDVRAAGQESARQVLEAIHDLPDVFAGVYYIPQFHAYQRALDLLENTGWI
jgi:homocysteine S-methyltransferase